MNIANYIPKFIFSFLLLFFASVHSSISFCQSQNTNKKKRLNTIEDTTQNFTLFKDRVVCYADLGFISSPFFVSFKNTKKINHSLTYRINHGIILGIGGSYKWFSARISYMVANSIEDKKKYGTTKYFGAHLGFPYKNTYSEINFLRFGGYVLINADKKIESYPNRRIIFPKISTLELTLSSYYFFNSDFSINPVIGRSGNYKTKTTSWYIKSILGYNHENHKDSTLIPANFYPIMNDKQKAERISAINIGVVPGFAYVNRYKNWQFSGVVGIGVSIQDKMYKTASISRHYLGVAPRIDLKINVGYNPTDWFIMLNSELDYRQISFYKLITGNPLFNVKLTGGYRFKVKEKTTNTASI